MNILPEVISQQDQIDLAAAYITQLRKRVDELKATKQKTIGPTISNTMNMKMGFKSPTFELRDLGSSIEVVIVSGVQRNFYLYEAISILEEEGAEVVNASFSTVGDQVFHTLHAQVH